MRQARHAFTLIELLVVVAIIGLLVAMLLPSLRHARNAAKDVKCLSNVRQWGVGTLMWSDQNRGDVPWDGPSSEILSEVVDGEGTRAFEVPYFYPNAVPPMVASPTYDQIMRAAEARQAPRDVPLPGDRSIFVCPSARMPTPGLDTPGEAPFAIPTTPFFFYFNYIINSKLENGTRDRWPINEEKARFAWIRYPSETVLLFDLRSSNDEFPDDIDRSTIGGTNLQRVHGKWSEMALRHRRGSNVLFADGSARPVDFERANTRQVEDYIQPQTWGYNQPKLTWTPLERAR